MAITTIQDLKDRATVIKNETTPGANTAARVGGFFTEVANRMEAFETEASQAILEEVGGTISNISSAISAEEERARAKEEELYRQVFEDFTTPAYLKDDVIAQDTYERNNIVKTGQLLSSEAIILNQGGLSMTYEDYSKFGTEFIGDETCCFFYKYFWWGEVETSQGVYNFNGIKNYVEQQVNEHRSRGALRLFPSTNLTNISPTISFQYNGTTRYFEGPAYIKDLILSEGQVAFYHGGNRLILDVNCHSVYQRWCTLWDAFISWFNATTIHDNVNNVDIPISSVVLYIDLGLLGPWGEGKSYDLDYTETSDYLLNYYKYPVEHLDIQFNIGQSVSVGVNLPIDSLPPSLLIGNELFIKGKELSNSAGYVGAFLDNTGSRNPAYFNNAEIVPGIKAYDKYKAYGERGDFFTGEFATFTSDYWGGLPGLWCGNTFDVWRAPHFRIHNLTVQRIVDNKSTLYPIKDITPHVYSKMIQALSSVGFRYVLTIYEAKKDESSVTVKFDLTNIGRSNLRFDIYKIYLRVRDLTTGNITDTPVNYDLRTLMPFTKPLLFSAGSGHLFSITVNAPLMCSVSLIIKDKLSLQNPLYLSNRNRQGDGSYILYSDIKEPLELEEGSYKTDTNGQYTKLETDKRGVIISSEISEHTYKGYTLHNVAPFEYEDMSLKKYNEFVVKINGEPSATCFSCSYPVSYYTPGLVSSIQNNGTNIEIHVNANVAGVIKFTDKYSKVAITHKLTFNYTANDYLRNSELDLADIAYTNIVTLGLARSTNNVHGDIAVLSTISRLAYVSCYQAVGMYGDIGTLNGMPLVDLNFMGCHNITGDISSLTSLQRIRTMQLTGCSITSGSVDDLVNNIIEEGLRADTLKIRISNTFSIIYDNIRYYMAASSSQYVTFQFNESNPVTITYPEDVLTEVVE